MRTSDTDRRTAAGPGAQLLTIPNVLSILRLLSVPVFIWLFLTGHELVGVYIYGTAAFTDFIDGYIARALDQVTEVGKMLDPLADRVFVIALAVALVVHGTLPWGLAVAVTARDVLVLALFPVLDRRGMSRIRVNLAGKTATAWLLFGLSWLAVHAGDVSWAIRPVGLVFVAAGAVAYWVSGALYIKEIRSRLRSPDATGSREGISR